MLFTAWSRSNRISHRLTVVTTVRTTTRTAANRSVLNKTVTSILGRTCFHLCPASLR
jgi:hypothetical protein